MLASVLEDEIPLRIYETGFENPVRKSLKTFQGVRRIGKDNVELLLAKRNEFKCIVPYGGQVGESQSGRLAFYERGIGRVHLH